MAHPQKLRLRALSADEQEALEAVARAGSERADRVARAKALLAVAVGSSFAAAARAAGRRSGVAVAGLVARAPGHGGGPPVAYGAAARERILREFRRVPDREGDGTATWSLTTLQRALRAAPDGLPCVSTKTLLYALWEAGYTWQQSRTWCDTGTVVRKRKAGPVTVTDPDATPKK